MSEKKAANALVLERSQQVIDLGALIAKSHSQIPWREFSRQLAGHLVHAETRGAKSRDEEVAALKKLVGIREAERKAIEDDDNIYRCKKLKAEGDGGIVDGCGWQGRRVQRCPKCGSDRFRVVDVAHLPRQRLENDPSKEDIDSLIARSSLGAPPAEPPKHELDIALEELRKIPRQPMPVGVLQSMLAFMRQNWTNDGAEGEAVHLLCNELERRLDLEEAAAKQEAAVEDSWADLMSKEINKAINEPHGPCEDSLINAVTGLRNRLVDLEAAIYKTADKSIHIPTRDMLFGIIKRWNG